jgi:hypothetical protein
VTKHGAGRWDYLACALLTVVPVVSHLAYQDFGFFTIDAIGLLAPAFLVGLGAGWAAQRTPRWVRHILLALLTIGFIDLQFNPESVASLKVFIVAAFVVVWLFRAHYTQIVTLSVAAILVVTPFRSNSLSVQTWEAPGQGREVPPFPRVSIVHIILDEQAAPRAFPSDIPEAVRAQERILSFYRRHGFRLYDKAYSRYFWSNASIPATLSPLAPEDLPAKVVERSHQRYVVRDSREFRWALSQGYRIHVFQTNYLDVCSLQRDLIASCRTVPLNSLSSIRFLPLNAPRRIVLEYLYFFSVESHLFRMLERELPPRQLGQAHAGTALRELAHLRARLRDHLAGSLYFVHLLSPHFPYELNRECEGRTALGERLGPGLDRGGGLWGNTPASRTVRWALYAEQVECLYTHLDSLMATIDSAMPPQEVRIVIHGDHGSRITRTIPIPENASQLTDQDLLDGFATLLAVRGPGVRPGIDSSPVAIQDLVPELIAGAPLGDRAGDGVTLSVFLLKPGSESTSVRLPAPSLARQPSLRRRQGVEGIDPGRRVACCMKPVP